MTNEQKIQNMPSWNLAEFIHAVSNNAIKITTCEDDCRICECSDGWCINNIAEWLKGEADE